jgi:flagellar hook-associated protein 2
MAISVGGLVTGLDTNSIITQLLAVDQRPIQLLQTKEIKLQAQSAAFQNLNVKLSSLKSAADSLTNPATLFSRSVTSSTETVATATAAPGSLRGTYALTVTGLARGSVATAATTKAATTDTVATGDGTFDFKLGTSGTVVSVAVSAATTLDQLVAAINDQHAGVTARAINTGTADTPAYQLTLTSSSTGKANDIVVWHDGTTLGIANTQGADDAKFTVSGLGSFTRSTNTFSDVLDGVAITLKAGTGSTDLSVSYDAGSTQSRVQGLLDAYNAVVKAIDTQTVGPPDSTGRPTTGSFTGDVVTRTIRNRLARTIATNLGGTPGTLAELGVTTQKDGTLTLDSTKFQQALSTNPDGLSRVLAGTSTKTGVADLLSQFLQSATKAITGTIATREDGINETIKSVQDQIDADRARLVVTERTLREKFKNLEQVVSQIQSTGNSLLSSLQSLQASLNASKQ